MELDLFGEMIIWLARKDSSVYGLASMWKQHVQGLPRALCPIPLFVISVAYFQGKAKLSLAEAFQMQAGWKVWSKEEISGKSRTVVDEGISKIHRKCMLWKNNA